MDQFRNYMGLGRNREEITVQSLALIQMLSESGESRVYQSTPLHKILWLTSVAGLVEKAVREILLETVHVDEQAVDSLLAAATLRPEDVRYVVQHVFIRKPVVGGIAARHTTASMARETAAKVYSMARQGEAFVDLVEQYSESQSRFRNGRITSRLRDLPPELAKVISGLKEGDVSRPLETVDGFHVFRCVTRQPVPAQTMAEKKQAIILRERRDAVQRRLSLDTKRILHELVSADRIHSRLVGTIETRSLKQENDDNLNNIASAIAITDLYMENKARIDRAIGADVAHLANAHLLAQQALKRKVAERMTDYTPKDDELRALYARQVTEGGEAVFDVDVLMLRAPDLESAVGVQKRAEALRDALVRRELDFRSAARQFSDFSRTDENGRVSGISRERIAALGLRFSKVLLNTPVGEFTPVVEEIPWGSKSREYWVGRIVNKYEERVKSFEEARRSLEQRALRNRQNAVRESLEKQLISDVTFHSR